MGKGAPNLVAAAQRAGVRRIVAESVIFAYGYPSTGPPVMDETDPYPGPPPKGGAEMLAALRTMEHIRRTHRHRGNRVALRHLYGPEVPHDAMFTRFAKWWALPALTGNRIVSWVHIEDVAKATADALDKGRGGQIYNVVDDRPQSFGDYVRELSAKLHRPPPPLALDSGSQVSPNAIAPYGATKPNSRCGIEG